MKKFLLLLLAGIGCHAQVPPASSAKVALTWTAPAATSSWTGCTTSAPCVYAVYRCTASAASCASSTSTSWAEITTASTRPSGTTYNDTTATGLTAYYIVETVQGTTNSGPSNTAGPFTVPGVPVAPAINGTLADVVKPAISEPPNTNLALSLPPPRLRGSISR